MWLVLRPFLLLSVARRPTCASRAVRPTAARDIVFLVRRLGEPARVIAASTINVSGAGGQRRSERG
jgi:hypothetical protein